VEVAKIVLGGIAGLTIAQLILWWMPWTKYRRDPFKLGPKVAAYASWIVPAQFHGNAPPPSQDGDGAESLLPDSLGPSGQGPVAKGPDSGIPQRTFVDPNKVQPEATSPGAAKAGRAKHRPAKQPKEPNDPFDDSTGPAAVESTEDDNALSPPSDTLDTPGLPVGPLDDLILDTELLDMIDDPSSEPAAVQPDGVAGDVAGPDESATTRIAGAPQVSPVQLRDIVADANDSMQAWLAAEDPSSRDLVLKAYKALARLGEAIAFSTSAGDEERNAISALLTPLAADDERLGSIRLLGSRWPTYSQRDNGGVLLTGTIADIKEEGELFVTHLAVSEDQDAIAVYSAADPADHYERGSAVLLLGAIIEDPTDAVAGYQGDADWLIWLGHSHAISGD
jgi:hypothetical protein